MKGFRPYFRVNFFRYTAAIVHLIFGIVLVSPNSQAQPLLREERQRAIDWFVNHYYYPKAVCAYANPDQSTRLDDLIATIRKENSRAFELAEASKEYAVTVAKVQPLITARLRDKSKQSEAVAECTSLMDQLAAAHRRRRHDDLFQLLLKAFTAPT